jgi:hypothetical protein
MSARTYFLKSAAVRFSVALVGAYIYERSGGELAPPSPESGPPDAPAEFLPGSKAPAWVVLKQARRESAAAKGPSKKGAGDKSAMLIPSTKSAVIFQVNPIQWPTSAEPQRP